MKPYKYLNAKPNILMLDVTSKALLIGLEGLNFSNRIAGKYIIFRRSADFPALVFLRLFAIDTVNKITNINRTESANDYIRLYLNFYFNAISQLKQPVSHYSQSQRFIYPVNSSESNFHSSILLLLNNKRVLVNRKMKLSTRRAELAGKGNFISIAFLVPAYKAGLAGSDMVIGKSEFPLLSLRVPIYQNKAILKLRDSSAISKGTILRSPQNNKQRFQHNRLGVFPDETPDSLLSRNDAGVRYSDKTLLSYSSGRMRKIPQEIIYHAGGNNYQNLSYVGQAKTSSDLKDSITKTINKSADLIFRKPVVQKADIVSGNMDYIHRDKQISTKATDNLTKNLSNEKTVGKIEINTIADRVYKIIEKRIAIEKDKRGLM